MQAYKVYYRHHYKWQICDCWTIVIASSEADALAQVNREFIAKMPGYSHYIKHKKLCEIKPDKATCVEYDFVPVTKM